MQGSHSGGIKPAELDSFDTAVDNITKALTIRPTSSSYLLTEKLYGRFGELGDTSRLDDAMEESGGKPETLAHTLIDTEIFDDTAEDFN